MWWNGAATALNWKGGVIKNRPLFAPPRHANWVHLAKMREVSASSRHPAFVRSGRESYSWNGKLISFVNSEHKRKMCAAHKMYTQKETFWFGNRQKFAFSCFSPFRPLQKTLANVRKQCSDTLYWIAKVAPCWRQTVNLNGTISR
jgi:hypothetical protein